MANELVNLYFRHDYSARNDTKLIRIKRKYGFEGIGIYWCLVEMLYENKGEITLDDLEDFCYDKGCDVEKAKGVCSIAFNVSRGKISSDRVVKELTKQKDISIKRTESANKRWGKTTVKEPEWMKKPKAKDNKPLTKQERAEAEELAKRLLGEKQ